METAEYFFNSFCRYHAVWPYMCYNIDMGFTSTPSATGNSSRLKSADGRTDSPIVIPNPAPAKPTKDASAICPNCSAELSAHRCKAVCTKCGFYLSCSDFH